jgi:DNA-binding CsgD family transcriptional regulator
MRTGGNPFFLEELIASSPARADHDFDGAPLPWTVSELVRAQFDDLDPEVRHIVAAASELGRRVPFDVLAAVTETSEGDLIRLLRAAVDSGLLVETETDVFGFHHEIAREAIASGLLGRERRRLHQAALDALRAAGSPDHAAMARHARGAGRFDDMVEEARLGAHEALDRGSTYQALQLAELALDEAEDDVDLLSVATRSAYLAGVIDDATAYGEQWLALARAADDVRGEARALSMLMRLAYEMVDLDRMATTTNELAGLADRLPDGERARAMAYVAQSYMLRDETDPTIEWADKAYELAEREQDTGVRLAALVEKGSVLLFDSRTRAEGKALLRATVEEAERAGEHVLAARALNNLVWHSLGRENADEVRGLIHGMQAHAKAAGWLAGSGHTEALAQLAAVEGDIDAAVALLDEPHTHHQSLFKKGRWQAVRRAGFALEVGDLDAAARHTAEAKPVTVHSAAGIHGLELHIAARRGDLAAARAILPLLLEAIDAEGYGSASQAHDLIAAGLTAGMTPDELRPLADRAGSYPRHRLAADDPWRLLYEAQFAEAEGRHAEAVDLYLRAVDDLPSAPGAIAGHHGTARVRAARSLVALGRLPEARAQVALAEQHLARWRGWRVDELRSVQRRLGVGDEPSGPALLTPREREVAALLAEGLTNSTIAERLFISPRTAAVHVSNILAKLGMASRAEVAAWAAGGGLDAD